MQKTNKILLALTLFALVSPLFSTGQTTGSNSTSSIYSNYGLGNLSGYSFGRSDGMGGLSIGIRNGFQVNTANPASYTSIDSMTFLMEFGLDSRNSEFSTTSSKKSANDVNFNHLTISVPFTKWWAVSFGVLPFSSKGYEAKETKETDNIYSSSNFTGTGNISKVLFGNAFKLGEHFSVGFNTWFLFGKLTDNAYIYYPNDANAYDYSNDKILKVNGFGITTGVQYEIKTKKENRLILGAVFEPKNKVSSDYSILEERALFRNSSTTYPIIDTLNYVQSGSDGLTLPSSLGGGFSYSIKNKITFGADYYYQKWKQSLFLGSTQEYLTNSSRYSTGLEFAPNIFSIRSYWDRVQYRVGAFYEKSYLTLREKQIGGYGVTLGLGLPLGRSMSSLNISAELGQMGTTDNNLIREKYAKITVHFLLHDRWFIKRKFD